jgi:hypothetical protein
MKSVQPCHKVDEALESVSFVNVSIDENQIANFLQNTPCLAIFKF